MKNTKATGHYFYKVLKGRYTWAQMAALITGVARYAASLQAPHSLSCMLPLSRLLGQALPTPNFGFYSSVLRSQELT